MKWSQGMRTRSARELVVRCGLAGVVSVAAAWPVTAQDQPKPVEPTPQEKEAAAKQAEDPNSVDAILKRMREEAAKAGVDVKKAEEAMQKPAVPPAVAPTPTPASAPTPAPRPTPPPGAQPGSGVVAPPARPVIPVASIPGAAPAGAALPPVAPDEVLLNFTDAVELPLLINFVRDELGLQIIAQDGGLRGQTIILTQPIRIKRDQLLQFLVMLLEDREYTLTQDFTGIYTLGPKNAVRPSLGTGPFTTTRIIQTPNIKPSTLQQAITTLININRGSAPASQPVFMDDLGIIMLTDTPRVTGLVE